MRYSRYIVKKRMRAKAICGPVNLRYGTILPVAGEYITTENGKPVCAVTSQNAKDYFWGYDPERPQEEIERQKSAAALMDAAPKDDGDALADPSNPWRRYGHLDEIMGGASVWTWDSAVEDLPKETVDHLLRCVESGTWPVV